jgi:prepilin-type N-terminal cleavage/methylation domain-containing protein
MIGKLQRKREEGFTIIEVLIVLAIAGLIMLIVFLAVPALQRNNRNTSRSNDVSRALGAAQEVLNNANGRMAAVDTDSLRAALGEPSYYELANITVGDGSASASTNPDAVTIRKGAKCVVDGNGVPTGAADAGSTRQFAAVFAVEGGSGAVSRCQDS